MLDVRLSDCNRGFTLTEVLMVLAIMITLVSLALPIYGNFQIKSQLNESSSLIVQALRVAKERSQSRVNNSAHGVWFSTDSYVLYQGASYSERDVNYDSREVFDNSVAISTTLSGDDVNFSKSLGQPNNTGTISIIHVVGGQRLIYINSLGLVDEE